MAQRQAVVKERALSYKRAPRGVKARILDELVELTGSHRDHARAALRQALNPPPRRPRTGRRPLYGPDLLPGLVLCWSVLRAPAGKPLAPMMPALVPLLRREKELVVTDAQAALLVRMSASTMLPDGRTHTRPGSLVKSQIPMRTWAEWNDAVPGFVEIDLIAHDGGNASGEYCFTLTVTDISTGWTVNRSVRNKAEKWVFDALQYVMAVFPFPVIGIDSDNGSEFINAHLYRSCLEHKITFTRSRPYNKNDGAHVEQKNWARVRQLVGYLRYDTAAELAKLNEIWELDRLFTNYLLPQQKVATKQRYGAKVIKHYDAPATPHQRAIKDPQVRKRPIITMNAAFKRIRPAHLQRDILHLTGELEKLSLNKNAPPPKPPVNTRWNNKG
ncbi:integrase catalytic domain-containing protein [Arthrobacter wenxiniae]|uniref:Transposase family protein n=1 Tax=Arthrobacter wenxiniae TaxID=2713570 RepID=A0A7Y7LZI6_9MICC|nr:DDE-type integrase/transposase/recombinase [Arthrobacter wenxiniae]NVM96580.1 transposase family protein [Arthrobacter wenxiniae]